MRAPTKVRANGRKASRLFSSSGRTYSLCMHCVLYVCNAPRLFSPRTLSPRSSLNQLLETTGADYLAIQIIPPSASAYRSSLSLSLPPRLSRSVERVLACAGVVLHVLLMRKANKTHTYTHRERIRGSLVRHVHQIPVGRNSFVD